MGMTIDNANKLLSVITSTITEDDDYFTIEDENIQVFKETLLTAIDTMRKYQKMKADYENRLKADMVAMLTEIQAEIKELWDSRYDVWLDNQYYIGKSDTLEEVDEVITQKIDALKVVSEPQESEG